MKGFFGLALGVALVSAPTVGVQGPVLRSTVQARSPSGDILATPADVFVDSVGVGTHWAYPTYASQTSALQLILIRSGIRHIRDEANTGSPIVMQSLSAHGIKATLLIDAFHGVIPNNTYWSGSSPAHTYEIAPFLKSDMPANTVDAIEMPNELDIFYHFYKWHPLDNATLSTKPSSTNYYGSYGEAVTKDCWREIKSDPALAPIKVIGPTVGVQVPSPYPPGSLYKYVDWGGFHPYPGRANTWTYPRPYDTIQKYYWNSFEPSVNVAADSYGGTPLMFTWYQPAFSNGHDAKPMVATETGYQTGSNSKSGISVTAQAKYVPRLFAEYFRNGIVRTFLYELYDEGTSSKNGEQNFGLVYHNLKPKPAYTALASLLHLLSDPGPPFTPGHLQYSVAVQSNGSYTRTEYVHDLLLQKRNGDFYLLLWHEISDTSDTDASGKPLPLVQRDIAPPPLAATITIAPEVASAELYTYDESWNLHPERLSIVDDKIAVLATDSVSVLRLSRAGL